MEGENARLKSMLKQKDDEMEDIDKVAKRLQEERGKVADIIRQEFADRFVIRNTRKLFSNWNCAFLIPGKSERVSVECRKTKTKVITLANQKGRRQSSKPMKNSKKLHVAATKRGKTRASHVVLVSHLIG